MNFLSDYRLYSSGNEAPEDFHVWAGFYALSCFCGRRFWTDQGFFTVFPNLYIVFVGRPGIKKTTAMDIAEAVVRDVNLANRITPQLHIPIAPTGVTKESLLETMTAKDSPCKKVFKLNDTPVPYTQIAIFCSELQELLQCGGDANAYITTLTNIADPRKDFDTKTISRGLQSLPGPYVTLFGCMTPETTGNLIKENALSGGFSRRCIFVYADRNSKPVPRPVITAEQNAAMERIVQRGKQLTQTQGKFEWTQGGQDYYDNWYNTINFPARENAASVAVQNFLMSQASIAIKLAMLLQLSESNELLLTEKNLGTAVGLLDAILPHVNAVFAGVGRNPHAATIAGIENFVHEMSTRAPHCVSIKKVVSRFLAHASEKEVRDLLAQMSNTDPPHLHHYEITRQGTKIKVVVSHEFRDKFVEFNRSPTPPPAHPDPAE